MSKLILTEKSNPISKAWIMLFWLLVVQVIVSLLGRSMSPLAPLLADDFSLSKFQVGLLPSAFFLGQLLISLPAGFLTDRFGSRKIMLFLVISLSISFGTFTFVHHFGLLLLFVFFGGLSYGCIHPVTNRGIIYWFPLNKRGTAMGIKQMGVTAGSALSVLILLPVALQWGWRIALLVSVTLLLIIGFLTYFFYQDPHVDLVKMHVSLPIFFHSIWQLMKEKPLLIVTLSAMGLNAIQMTLNTYLIFFALEQLKFSIIIAGSLLLVSELSGAVGRIIWGIVSDRMFGGRRLIVLMIVAILSLVGCVLMAFMSEGISLWVVILVSILFGLSVSGFNGIWMNIATESVSKENTGLVSGFSIALGSFGVVFGPPVFGAMLEITNSYSIAWFLLGALSIIVFFLIVWAGKLYHKAGIKI